MKISEKRMLDASELRVEGEDAPHIKGYAARFDKWSEKLYGMFREKISPGAFSKTLKENDIVALINHDVSKILGRNTAGTLSLEEDDKGLAFDITVPDTTDGRDLVVSMKRGDISKMSFGFVTVRDEWNEKGSERVLHEVKLTDVSVVTRPAYPQTSASVRSLLVDEANEFRFEDLSCLFFRAGRDEITEEDRSLISSSIEILRGMLPAEKQTPEPTPTPGSSHLGESTPGSSHLPSIRSRGLLAQRLHALELELTL